MSAAVILEYWRLNVGTLRVGKLLMVVADASEMLRRELAASIGMSYKRA